MNEDDAKILFVVQPNERNVFDQRIIAQRLWTKHGVASIRATLREIDANAAVDQTTKRLTYGASDGRRDAISVVYYRAGYAPTDYPGEEEWRARELLEKSSAVKSPSAAMHLAGCKKIQQALAQPGVLERFVDDVGECAEMRKVFAGLYAMDGEEAMEAVKLGLENPGAYVLKPQREGGGNNLYGDELVDGAEDVRPSGVTRRARGPQRVHPDAAHIPSVALDAVFAWWRAGAVGDSVRVGGVRRVPAGGGCGGDERGGRAFAANEGGDERRGWRGGWLRGPRLSFALLAVVW